MTPIPGGDACSIMMTGDNGGTKRGQVSSLTKGCMTRSHSPCVHEVASNVATRRLLCCLWAQNGSCNPFGDCSEQLFVFVTFMLRSALLSSNFSAAGMSRDGELHPSRSAENNPHAHNNSFTPSTAADELNASNLNNLPLGTRHSTKYDIFLLAHLPPPLPPPSGASGPTFPFLPPPPPIPHPTP